MKHLHARPNLEHLKKQAKALAAKRGAKFRLADAQLEIAREAGFKSWPKLVRHVDLLRGLEGEWQFVSLEVDGAAMPGALAAPARILIDGDRFQSEMPGAVYDGAFDIDVDLTPCTIDINFVEGPEAGNTAKGIFELDGDQLTICLGLVGNDRPKAFKTAKGSGHALERLRRATGTRPAGVTGGKKKTGPLNDEAPSIDVSGFDAAASPMLQRMEGEWAPTQLIRDGEPMDAQWLGFGSRIGSGNEVKVVFGGQTMVHAKVRVDEHMTPMAIDYLGLAGAAKGRVSLGILEWRGDELVVNMSSPGQPRPADFTAAKGSGRTLSQWKLTMKA